MILDAAIRVFAREGFHRCRVSDIANEAGVAYGLVYHYFRSKDEVLDTLFTERWTLLLEAIAQVDARDLPIREKLHAIASFIVWYPTCAGLKWRVAQSTCLTPALLSSARAASMFAAYWSEKSL